MELVTDFESLAREILKKHNEDICITVGVLLADYRQSDAREYILDYLDHFDKLSGKYIDFYLPGYYLYSEDSTNKWKRRDHYNICISRHCSANEPIYIDRLHASYYFDEYLFEDFLREINKKTSIKYTYNPMLILLEIDNKKGGGQLQYQRKLIIDLSCKKIGGVKKAGQLFEMIFEIAKREVNLDRFKKKLKMRYIKGNVISKIVSILEGKYIELIGETIENISMFRLK